MTDDESLDPADQASPLVLEIRPDAEEWGSEDDDRWRADLADLEFHLRQQLPGEVRDAAPQDGLRGLAEWSDVIIALGSAGAVTAVVDIIKTWIAAKPGRRKVRVSVRSGGQQRSVTVDGDGLGAAEVQSLAARALDNKAGDEERA